jgi:cobalamin biosynthesis Co2+ chelatase CbiK
MYKTSIIKIKHTLKYMLESSGFDPNIIKDLDDYSKADDILDFIKENFRFCEIDDGK